MRNLITGLGALVIGAVILSGCASMDASGEYDRNYNFSVIQRVAVVAVEGAGGSKAAQNQVAGMFNQSLMRKGYSPVERAQIQAVMEEQNFQQGDATSPSGAAALGRILNVDAVMMVNVPKYEDEMSMTVQMVDTDDASIVWSASGHASAREGLTRQVGKLLGASSGAAAGYEADGALGAVVGGAAGGVAGDAVGRTLTPEQQQHAAKLVVELSSSLPDRL